MIATINTSSTGLLASVVLALYYAFHAIRDGIAQGAHRVAEATLCRAELLRVSSHTNSSNTSACRATKGRRKGEQEQERERERERESGEGGRVEREGE